MKFFRLLFFVIIVSVVTELVFYLLPLSIGYLLTLSNLWLVMYLLVFGGLTALLYAMLPSIFVSISSKISPDKRFAFYYTVLVSTFLGIGYVYFIWTSPNVFLSGMSVFIAVMLTFLIIGITVNLSFGSAVLDRENPYHSLGRYFKFGTILFGIGIFLVFSLFSTKICRIYPDKNYTWLAGIWHGIFVIPNWVVSWFDNEIYCKAPKATGAYSIFWWISFIFIGLSVLGRRSDRES